MKRRNALMAAVESVLIALLAVVLAGVFAADGYFIAAGLLALGGICYMLQAIVRIFRLVEAVR